MCIRDRTYLNDTKTEQDQTNRTDKAENEIGQVIHNGKRIACGKSRCRPVSYTHLDVYKRQVFAEPFPTVLIVFFPAERADSFTAFFGCSTALIL